MINIRTNNVNCIQINFCRSKYASTQLINFIEKNDILLAFIQEPYVVKRKVCGFPLCYEVIYFNCDDSNQIPKSAILVKKSQLLALNIRSFSSNCVTICSISFVQKKVLFISAYCSPNCDMTDILKNIQTVIDKIKPNYYLIAMDSNAHSNVWFDRRNDERGHEILQFIAKNNLILLNNNEEEPTFDSSRGQSSID
jgi:hypothetical protein